MNGLNSDSSVCRLDKIVSGTERWQPSPDVLFATWAREKFVWHARLPGQLATVGHQMIFLLNLLHCHLMEYEPFPQLYLILVMTLPPSLDSSAYILLHTRTSRHGIGPLNKLVYTRHALSGFYIFSYIP